MFTAIFIISLMGEGGEEKKRQFEISINKKGFEMFFTVQNGS